MKTRQAVFFIMAILALIAFSACTTSTYYGVSYTYGTSWGHSNYGRHHHHRPPPPPAKPKPKPPGKPGGPNKPKPPGGKPKPKPRR